MSWSKEFLCAAKDVGGKYAEIYAIKKGTFINLGTTALKRLGKTRPMFENRRLTGLRKCDGMTPGYSIGRTKTDLEQLGKDMFDRIFFYIEKNNINSFQLIFDHYKSSGKMDLMKEQCESMRRDDTKMQCKLTIVFNRLAQLVIDHMGPTTRWELSMLYLLLPKVYEIMDIASKARNKTLCHRLMTMFQSLYDNALNQDGNKIKNHFGKFGSIYDSAKRDCADTYQNDFEQLTCYLAETFTRMDKLRSALGANYDNWQSRPVCKSVAENILHQIYYRMQSNCFRSLERWSTGEFG